MRKILFTLFLFASTIALANDSKGTTPIKIEKQLEKPVKLEQEKQEENLTSSRNWSVTCLGGKSVITEINATGTFSEMKELANSLCGKSWAIRGAD